MGDLVHFVPRAERNAEENLAEFVRMAREDLVAFGAGGAWDEDHWRHQETVAVFATKTAPSDSYAFTPMADPFKEFAKAYVRYRYSHRPTKQLNWLINALRCVEAGLLSATGAAKIARLNGAVMDICAQKCREFYASDAVRCNTGREIQKLFDFLREKNLVPSLPAWKSPFKKPAILTEDLGPAGEAYRAAKLPSNAVMLMVADLFSQANDPESRYFSAIMILLMATPSRISEVLRLPVDCIQWEADEAGAQQMYLRWRAAKGKGAMKKWVVPAMHDVVKEAVQRLVEIGAPAREAARFAFERPGQFMRHPGCIVDTSEAGSRPLLPDEFCAAVGLNPPRRGRRRDGTQTWTGVKTEKGLAGLIRQGATSYVDLANYVRLTYAGAHWPHIDPERTVRASEALCLHRDFEFHRQFLVKNFSWRLPTRTEVLVRFGPEKGLSLFERMGFKNVDGSSIKLTTHQPRHWLSTMSERAGMDDFTLAQWAGRAKVADNRHYDHRTPEERLDAAMEVVPAEQPSMLERFKARQPVTYQELGIDRLGTAKATLYGMCVHDYAMVPCQKQRECMTCKEHVCIKGDHVTLERLERLEAQTEFLLQRAQQAHKDGDFGADRWVDNHKWKLAHVRTMRIALQSPQVPDGAVLSIPEGHDPSAVRRALMDLDASLQPEASIPRLTVTRLALS